MDDLAAQLRTWLRSILDGGATSGQLAHVFFPSDDLLAEYLKGLDDRSEADVKSLLRRMLGATTSRADTLTHELLTQALREGRYPAELEFAESYYRTQRKLAHGVSDTWEGMTWALEMLPFKPGKSLQALDLYMEAGHGLPEQRIHSLSDASAIIRARWVSNDSSHAGRISLLKTLSSRNFEALTASLWECMGYEVVLTEAQGDGGFDLRAQNSLGERRDVVLVECKLRNEKSIG
jgi:restriction system protein